MLPPPQNGMKLFSYGAMDPLLLNGNISESIILNGNNTDSQVIVLVQLIISSQSSSSVGAQVHGVIRVSSQNSNVNVKMIILKKLVKNIVNAFLPYRPMNT